MHDFKYPILKDLRRRRKGIPLEGKRRIGEWIESAKERYRPAFNERPTLGHCSTPWVEINAALHWPIGEPGIYNKMFKYATSHLRHPTRRILAFFAVENNGASIVPLLPRYHRTAVSHFPRDRLLNGERCYTPSSYSLMRSLFSKRADDIFHLRLILINIRFEYVFEPPDLEEETTRGSEKGRRQSSVVTSVPFWLDTLSPTFDR